MQQITSPSIDKLPKVGYWASKEEKKENIYKTESHIHRQGPLSGVKATAHKLTNDFLTYFPKGFSGSKNSDFYEFLSLGMVPYIVGSATLISLYNLSRGKMNTTDAEKAARPLRKMAAGVILYAVGKWISPKVSRLATRATTGVNLDMNYINKVNEVPENGNDKGLVRTQYPKVFDSVDFYRKDLLEQDGDLNHNNIYAYYDKIAKKAGFKEKLNAPNQTMGNKIRELKARSTALESISKYITAACGVAIGAQEAFAGTHFHTINPKKGDLKSATIGNLKAFFDAFKKGVKTLWNGPEFATGALRKHAGKALILASIVSTLAAWLIPTKGFKTNPSTMKAQVDESKEFEVC